MRRLFLLLCLTSALSGFSQRYLTEVFSNLDSTIAGVYGNAINYQSINENLLFDFYAPAEDTLAERPLIIYIHGGGFNTGSRTLFSIQEICRTMARKGYAVANIDYRLDPNFDIYNSPDDKRAMTDAMHDAKQAIRFFKANTSTFGIDTSQVFIGGESAGAITSMMASYVDKQSEMIPYPMANPNDPMGSSVNADISNNVVATMCLCGMILDTTAMETSTDPSLMWIHGTNDSFIPVSFAFNVVLRAENIGLNYTAIAYQDTDHCPWFLGSPNWQSYLDSVVTDITEFLYPFVNGNISNVEELSANTKPTIYPNPFDSHLTVIPSNPKKNKSTIQIFDAVGEKIYHHTYLTDEKGITINLDYLRSGMYFLVLDDQTIQILKK